MPNTELIKFDEKGVSEFRQFMSNLAVKAPEILHQSLNVAINYQVELTQKSIGELTTLDASLIKQQVTKGIEHDKTLATMRLLDRRIPLAQFRMQPMIIQSRLSFSQRRHEIVQMWKERPGIEYKHAFFATMPSGHHGLFERRGRNRLPIDELKGQSMAGIYRKTPGFRNKIERLSSDVFIKELGNQTQKLLEE